MELLDRSIPPLFKTIDEYSIEKVSYENLSNGIELFYLNNQGQKLTKIDFVFLFGKTHEQKVSSISFLSKLLLEGTKNYNGHDLKEKIAFYGSFIDINFSQTYFTITVYLLPRYTDEICALVKEIVTNSTLPNNELEKQKKISIQNLKISLEKTAYLASQNLNNEIFGTHPYGTSPSEASINAINKSDIDNLYQFLNFSNCQIYYCGNYTEEISQILNNHFGNSEWKGNTKPKEEKPLNISSTPNKLHIPKVDAIQCSIRMGLITINRHHEDFPKLAFVNEILGGYFGSRLMQNIREDKGYTYGISSQLKNYPDVGLLIIGTDAKGDCRDATIFEINKEINLLKNEVIDENELETVKNYLLGSFLNAINGSMQMLDRFKSLNLNNQDYNYLDKYFNDIKNMTANDVKVIANKYLDTNKLYTISVGPK